MAKKLKIQQPQLTGKAYSNCLQCKNGTEVEYSLIDCKKMSRFPALPNCLFRKLSCIYFTKVNS